MIKDKGRALGYHGIPGRVVFSGGMVVLVLSAGSVFCHLPLRQGRDSEAHAVSLVSATTLSWFPSAFLNSGPYSVRHKYKHMTCSTIMFIMGFDEFRGCVLWHLGLHN